MNKFFTRSLVCLASAAVIVACNGNKKAAQKAAEEERAQFVADSLKQEKALEIMATLPEEPEFVINTNLGAIKVRLYSKTPKHRDNFAKLALTGYYDSLLFHRVINGFMIQGGDPLSKDPEKSAEYGKGGPSYTVPAEIIPEYTHKKGALAAARRGDAANPKRESSGSQFYLVQDEVSCASLDGDYSVFGETVEGLDVIDKIAAVQTDARNLPLSPVRILSVELVKNAE